MEDPFITATFKLGDVRHRGADLSTRSEAAFLFAYKLFRSKAIKCQNDSQKKKKNLCN